MIRPRISLHFSKIWINIKASRTCPFHHVVSVYMFHRSLVHLFQMIIVVHVHETCRLARLSAVLRELLLLGVFRSSTCTVQHSTGQLLLKAYLVVVHWHLLLFSFLPKAQQPQKRQRRKRYDRHGERQPSTQEPGADQTNGRQGCRTTLLCSKGKGTASPIL